MATTDSNGILRYQDTDGAPTPPVVNTWLQSVSDALSLTKNGTFFSVTNIAERASKATAFSPTVVKPLLVFRADAGAGNQFEYTTDGIEWRTIITDSPWFDIIPEGNWQANSHLPRVRKKGNTIEMAAGRIQRVNNPASASAGTPLKFATFPTGFAPTRTEIFAGSAHFNSTAPAYADIRAQENGLYLTSSTSGTLVAGSATSYIVVPSAIWTV